MLSSQVRNLKPRVVPVDRVERHGLISADDLDSTTHREIVVEAEVVQDKPESKEEEKKPEEKPKKEEKKDNKKKEEKPKKEDKKPAKSERPLAGSAADKFDFYDTHRTQYTKE